MRCEQVATVVVWGTCSGLASGVLVYLGANTAPYQASWPLAMMTGAAVGVGVALLVLRLLGNRRKCSSSDFCSVCCKPLSQPRSCGASSDGLAGVVLQ